MSCQGLREAYPHPPRESGFEIRNKHYTIHFLCLSVVKLVNINNNGHW